MRHLVLGALVVAAVALINALLIGGDLPTALAASAICLPTSGPVMFLFSRLGPAIGPLLLVAFAGGALVAGPIAGALNDATAAWALGVLDPGPALTWFSAGEAAAVEELLKLGAVVLIVLWRPPTARDDWIRTILLGAAAGVGFDLGEASVNLDADLANGDFIGLGADWFIREFIGVIPGHPAYTALAAAGLGAAYLTTRRGLRVLFVWSGLAAGIAAHFIWDAWGAGLPAPDGLVGFGVSVAETLLVDGVSFATVLAILAILLRARSRQVLPAPDFG